MKKIRLIQLKIKTDADDFSNGKTMYTNNTNNTNTPINHVIRNNKLTTSTINMHSLSPGPKNFGATYSTKTNKITELSKRHSSNVNGNNEIRQSLIENKNDAKSHTDKINVLGNVYEKFAGGVSPKMSNGIASKNSK
jgi:hypothetical protein